MKFKILSYLKIPSSRLSVEPKISSDIGIIVPVLQRSLKLLMAVKFLFAGFSLSSDFKILVDGLPVKCKTFLTLKFQLSYFL